MFKTNKTKSIATLVAFGLIAIVLVAFGIKINKQDKTVTLGGLSYAVGTINSTNGKINESNYSLYTKSMGKVEGLEIKLNDNASITYKVASRFMPPLAYESIGYILKIVVGMIGSIAIGQLLGRFTPRVLRVLCGGRG